MEPAANALVPIAEELEDVYAQIDLLEVSVGLCVVKGCGGGADVGAYRSC